MMNLDLSWLSGSTGFETNQNTPVAFSGDLSLEKPRVSFNDMLGTLFLAATSRGLGIVAIEFAKDFMSFVF